MAWFADIKSNLSPQPLSRRMVDCSPGVIAHRTLQPASREIARAMGAVTRSYTKHATPTLAALSQQLAAPAEPASTSCFRDRDTALDAGEYLEAICRSICRAKLDAMHIQLEFKADRVLIEADRCWRMGMIVCELVTNAARAVFRPGKHATIRIDLRRAESWAACEVSYHASSRQYAQPLLSSKPVEELAESLDGSIAHRRRRSSSISTLHFVPL